MCDEEEHWPQEIFFLCHIYCPLCTHYIGPQNFHNGMKEVVSVACTLLSHNAMQYRCWNYSHETLHRSVMMQNDDNWCPKSQFTARYWVNNWGSILCDFRHSLSLKVLLVTSVYGDLISSCPSVIKKAILANLICLPAKTERSRALTILQWKNEVALIQSLKCLPSCLF